MEQIAGVGRDESLGECLTRYVRYVFVVCVLLTVSGCGDLLSEREKFEFHKRMWNALNFQNYDFSYKNTGTFGGMGYTEVRVRNGEVYSLTDSEEGEITVEDTNALTMESLFDEIESRLEMGERFDVRVEYDSRYFYPADAAFDTEKALLGFAVFDFKISTEISE